MFGAYCVQGNNPDDCNKVGQDFLTSIKNIFNSGSIGGSMTSIGSLIGSTQFGMCSQGMMGGGSAAPMGGFGGGSGMGGFGGTGTGMGGFGGTGY